MKNSYCLNLVSDYLIYLLLILLIKTTYDIGKVLLLVIEIIRIVYEWMAYIEDRFSAKIVRE